jgi:tetratricopeptide (TPR) repeat protein
LEALPLYEKTLGPDDPAVSRTLNRLGTAYYNLKRYDEAIDAYRRALEATRRTLGPRHPTVAVRLGNMSLVLQDQGKMEESLQALLESMSVEESALGPTHPRLAITHSNLASLLGDMGRPAEALEHARKAVAIDEANDPDPADAGASWSNVADDLFLLGRHAEAAAAARKARDLMTRAAGAPPEWIAAVEARDRLVLGDVCDQFRNVEALVVLDAALPVGDADNFGAFARHQLGADGADVAEALNRHARALEVEAEVLRGFACHDHDAAPGGLAAAERTAHFDRLARHDRR